MTTLETIPRVVESGWLGSLFAFRDERVALLRRAFQTDARLARIRLGPVPVVLVNDPDLAHEVLVERATEFGKFQVRGMPAATRLLGRGVLQTDGEEHKAKRRRLMPAFLPARVATYAAVMAEETERQQASWQDGATIRLDAEMDQLVLAIFLRTLFGVDRRDAARALGESIVTTIATAVAESIRFLHLPLWWPTSEHRRFARALSHLESTIDALVAERRAAGGAGDDLLSLLVRSSDQGALTDAEVRQELLNLVVAGFEATTSSLAWTLHHLASDPDRARRVRDEAVAALAGRSPGAGDLPRIPAALAAFQEGMRLYPAAHIIVRQTTRPVQLDGHAIAAHVHVFVNGYAIHRRPDRWTRGDEFVPERFAQGEPDRRAWFPFGEGPRTCIGNHFAMLEGQIVVATLVQRVELATRSAPAADPVAAFALRPAGPLEAQVRRL
jgi:cytochrome P450